MRIGDELKCDIQAFVYFLFSDMYIIGEGPNYVDHWLADKSLAYQYFEGFAFKMRTAHYLDFKQLVGESEPLMQSATTRNKLQVETPDSSLLPEDNFWKAFLELAQHFCYNSFPRPAEEEYFLDLCGCGTSAVPVFAV
ncbi:MAG: hypothetical protein ACRYFZ_05005 [Janthinobacterium lividum]